MSKDLPVFLLCPVLPSRLCHLPFWCRGSYYSGGNQYIAIVLVLQELISGEECGHQSLYHSWLHWHLACTCTAGQEQKQQAGSKLKAGAKSWGRRNSSGCYKCICGIFNCLWAVVNLISFYAFVPVNTELPIQFLEGRKLHLQSTDSAFST